MLKTLWRRRRNGKIRNGVRGYRRLVRDGNMAIIEATCARLLETGIEAKSGYARFFFGAATPNAELAVRQYLFLRLILYKFPGVLLAQVGAPDTPRIAYPLPPLWQDIVERAGFPVNRFLCSALWHLWLFAMWTYGAASALKLIVLTAIAGLKQPGRPTAPFSHFESITEAQTPRLTPDGRSDDVVSWYLQWPGKPQAVNHATYRKSPGRLALSDAVATPIATPVLPRVRFGNWLRFGAWCLGAVLLSFFGIFTKRWWHPLLLHESVLAALARHVQEDAVARDYLHNNSGWLYRPLWSYETEHRGARVLFYHYSTNSAQFKRPSGYPPEHHTWKHTNWPLHLVWDEEQAAFVTRASSSTETWIVGPIWFSSSPEPLDLPAADSIAVFDVQPFRPARYSLLADEFNYYTPATCVGFLEDVARACKEAGFQMAWKRKRNIGKIAHPAYRLATERLDRSGGILLIPAEHSAIRAIEHCRAVVSLPFTSTALIGAHLGKPSCYYDPTGKLQKDDRSARNLPLLRSYEELLAWVQKLADEAPHVKPEKGAG